VNAGTSRFLSTIFYEFAAEIRGVEYVTSDAEFRSNAAMNAKVPGALVLAVLSLACSSTGAPGGGVAGSSNAAGAGTTAGNSGSSNAAGAAGSSSSGGAGNGGGGTTAGGAAGASGASSGASGMAGAGGVPVACQPPLPVTGTAVTVNVDLAMVKATVTPEVMSVHTSAYDNAMGSATTPPLLKAAGVRSLRYPGGSYADGYHWSTHTMTGGHYVAAGAHFGAFVALLDAVGAGALITVNYGSNPQGTGPGVPQEAAAWVAYANGTPTSTTSIGLDATGTDWKTVGYWASLRAASKLATDDGLNFLRIGRAAPIGIKYWELGNELYGNGFYYGGEGWEIDLHVPQDGTARKDHPDLSPAKYGAVFPTFATAMKAVDPTIKVGAVLHWPYNEYTSPDWNDNVLSSATCAAMDFGVNHWYAGASFSNLLTTPRTDIPKMFSDLADKVAARCPTRSGKIPLAITEWGPNVHNFEITPPASTQLVGVFAADSYAHFMEQGAIHVDWLELHNDSYLTEADVPQWGYKGQQMAGYLANAGDTMVAATLETPPEAFAEGLLQAHAAKRMDGSVTVMLVNTSPTAVAAATIKVAGLIAGTNLPCVGTRYTYAPVNGDNDGQVTPAPIFSSNDATNQVSVEVPAYSVVVLAFPKG
jgi:alpha-L-arabinofuranosidase